MIYNLKWSEFSSFKDLHRRSFDSDLVSHFGGYPPIGANTRCVPGSDLQRGNHTARYNCFHPLGDPFGCNFSPYCFADTSSSTLVHFKTSLSILEPSCAHFRIGFAYRNEPSCNHFTYFALFWLQNPRRHLHPLALLLLNLPWTS